MSPSRALKEQNGPVEGVQHGLWIWMPFCSLFLTLKHSFRSMHRRSNQARRELFYMRLGGERTEVWTAGTSYFNGHKPTPMGNRQQPLEMKGRVSRCYAPRAGFLAGNHEGRLGAAHQKRIRFQHVTTALGLPQGIICALNKYVRSTVRIKAETDVLLMLLMIIRSTRALEKHRLWSI